MKAKMNLTRSWKSGLLLVLMAAFAGCLGAQPGAPGGAGSAAAGGDIPSESTFKGAVPDEAASSAPKPLPGGAVGTGDSWGDDPIYAAQGSVSRCELMSRVAAVKTTLKGQLVAIEEGKKVEGSPAGPPTVSYLRLMDVNGAAIACTDLKLDSDSHFEGEIQISAPANVKLIVFMVNLFGFGSEHPDCDPQYDPLKSENPPKYYGPVKNEIDFSPLSEEESPKC